MVQTIVEQLALIGLLGLLVKLTLWAQPDASEAGELWERQSLPTASVLPASKEEAG